MRRKGRCTRLLSFALVSSASMTLVLYLLTTREDSPTQQNEVSIPWHGGDVANLEDKVTPVADSTLFVEMPSVHKKWNSGPFSAMHTSRKLTLDSECRSKNRTLSWRMLAEKTREAVAQRIVVSDHHKLLYCTVPLLSMGSLLKLMYFISPLGAALPSIANVPSKEVGIRNNFVYLSSLSLAEQEKRLESYLSFMVSRHPFSRLATTYKLKFATDNPFFHDRYGRDIVKKYRRGFVESDPLGNDVKFLEFVEYILESRAEEMNEHWQPLESLCQPCAVNFDLTLHYEAMDKELLEVLELAHLTDSVGTLPSDRWESVDMTYVDNLLKGVPPSLVGQLVKVFRDDFAMFSYSSLL